MSFFATSALVNALVSAMFGIFIILKNKASKLHQTFFLFCLAVTIWSSAYYFWQIANLEPTALFWSRTLMVGALFIPVTYLHFVFTVVGLEKQKRKFIVLSYCLFTTFLPFTYSDLFVTHVASIAGFTFWPMAGPLFTLFLATWLLYIIYTIFLLFYYWKHANGLLRAQVRLITIGTIIGYLGGITNFFLWYKITILPYGNISTVVYLALVAYAVAAYRLLDVKIIATELFAGLLVVISFFSIFEAKSAQEIILRVLFFLITLFFGVLLIRSVLKEVRRREELEKITHQLASATKRLQKANRELKKLDEAKSEFISIASHQLRTPLTAIKGYGSMLLAGDFGKLANLKQKDAVNKMFLSNDRLITLVENLLNVSRIESGRINFTPHPMQLEDVVSDIITTLTNNAREAGLYLKLDKPAAPLPLVNVDEEKIRQTIINFIDNAIKYTRQGGITVELRLKGKNVQCCVRDTGIGISPDDQKKLFKKFSRGKDAFMINSTGNGLGLYVAHMMVAGHNGKVWVESEGEGKGSSFCFSVPITELRRSDNKVANV